MRFPLSRGMLVQRSPLAASRQPEAPSPATRRRRTDPAMRPISRGEAQGPWAQEPRDSRLRTGPSLASAEGFAESPGVGTGAEGAVSDRGLTFAFMKCGTLREPEEPCTAFKCLLYSLRVT